MGEILLRNVKFSLRSSEIAAAMGGFDFIRGKAEDFIFCEGQNSYAKLPEISFFVAHSSKIADLRMKTGDISYDEAINC